MDFVSFLRVCFFSLFYYSYRDIGTRKKRNNKRYINIDLKYTYRYFYKIKFQLSL